MGYNLGYRLGFTPWERYANAAAASIGALLDQETAERSSPPGRAMDVGCGRGLYTRELAGRGWQVVGVDSAPGAIEAANRSAIPGARFVVGDVTDLAPDDLGTFDLFLDIGCLQGLSTGQRLAAGRVVSGLANPDATLLMLAFGQTRMRSIVGGVSRAEVESAFADWSLLWARPADTAGLGWPLNTTAPHWYRFRRRAA
jgi:SAM-dependent methyltransferase